MNGSKIAAGLGMLNRPVVSASLRIQRTKERGVTRGGGGERATYEKIEEKTGDERSIVISEEKSKLRKC